MCIRDRNYPLYVKQISELQKKYSKDISIKLGLEFGIQTHTIPQYEALFKKYPFDFIILSIHQIEDKEFWTGEFQEGRTQQEYNERYYEELLNVVKSYKNYSVLGHPDPVSYTHLILPLFTASIACGVEWLYIFSLTFGYIL